MIDGQDTGERIAAALERIADALEGMKAEPDPLAQMIDQLTGFWWPMAPRRPQ